MNNPQSKFITLLLAASLGLTAFSTSAYAMGNGSAGTYPATAQTIAPTFQEAAVPLTPEGNLTLVDDIRQAEGDKKQFVTLKTKAGNTFYLVIDRTGEQENVYFMNLVDEADLMALVDKNTLVDTPLTGGSVLPEPTVDLETPTEAEANPNIESPERKSFNMLPLMIVLVLALAGGALWFLKLRSPKSSVKGRTDLGSYDFSDDEDEEYITEDEDDAESQSLERDPE